MRMPALLAAVDSVFGGKIVGADMARFKSRLEGLSKGSVYLDKSFRCV